MIRIIDGRREGLRIWVGRVGARTNQTGIPSGSERMIWSRMNVFTQFRGRKRWHMVVWNQLGSWVCSGQRRIISGGVDHDAQSWGGNVLQRLRV